MKKTTLLLILLTIWQFSIFSQGCLPDGIIFNSQSEVDSFPINYPNCTEIEGFVTISGDGITNLDSLYSLTSIEGGLALVQNPKITDISGLSNLKTTFYLVFFDNDSLTSLSGLDSLIYIDDYITIEGNERLMDLNALENITIINGDFWITNNNTIVNFSGLDKVTHIKGNLHIWGDSSLIDFTGMENIITVNGDVIIESNHNLIDMNGIDNLSTIGGDLEIRNDSSLINMEGLNNLISIGGSIRVEENTELKNLAGLDKLSSIGGSFSIWNNPNLIDLTGVESLTTIGSNLSIRWNDKIISLNGINNIDPLSIYGLYIHANPYLTQCEIESVCGFLKNPLGEVFIFSNGSGCYNQEEVESACNALLISDIPNMNNIIFPNPAKRQISITNISGLKVKRVIFINTFGQEILEVSDIKNRIDISTLNQGIYTVNIITNNNILKTKLVISQ